MLLTFTIELTTHFVMCGIQSGLISYHLAVFQFNMPRHGFLPPTASHSSPSPYNYRITYMNMFLLTWLTITEQHKG